MIADKSVGCFDSVNPIIETASGIRFNISNPKPEDISISDIAHSLSMQCRYNGHCKKFYSVAEHSVLVSNIVFEATRDKDAAFLGLMHDCSEAYVSDICRPLKQTLGNYIEIEDALLDILLSHYGIENNDLRWMVVKFADSIALKTEARFLMDSAGVEWGIPEFIPALDEERLFCWNPDQAEREFILRFGELQ